jgi:hypothetical protein
MTLDQRTLPSTAAAGTESVADLTSQIAAAVRRARIVDAPFLHLELEDVFPPDVYRDLLATMPSVGYRAMSGRSKNARRDDGSPTRVKIDLFPEYIRRFSADGRALWQRAGAALRSRELQQAFADRLAPGLTRRFGDERDSQRFYPIPILTRDTPGYSIHPHTDTRWKAITVQLYLPPDHSITHVGTVFHERLADGTLKRTTQIPFAPNSGYAFAVGDNTWHSADVVGPEVRSRDSILLTYFVDTGTMLFMRNRLRRTANVLKSELHLD